MKGIIYRIGNLASIAEKLKLDPDSEMAGELRASQIRAMISTTPLMMVVITATALIMVAVLHGHPNTEYLMIWALGLCCFSSIGYVNSRKSDMRPRVEWVSRNGPKKAARGVLLIGTMWGLVPAVFYPITDFSSKITIIAVIGGILGGGAISLYMVPRAMFTFLGVVSIGTIIGLARSGDTHDFAIVALLSCYAVALMRAGWTLALTFAESTINAMELKEKSETIAVLLREFSESASDWLWQTDANGGLAHGEEGFLENLGIVPMAFSQDHPVSTDRAIIPQIKGMQDVRRHWNARTSFTDLQLSVVIEGQIRWISISGKPLYDANGEYNGFRGVASNITENKLAEERIAYLAHNDALTGLVNRGQFSNAIKRQLNKHNETAPWAVMFLDLDGFKLVNDSKGHAVGDALLEEVAMRIKKQVDDDDIVARLGGDEFAVLSLNAGSIQAISTLSERLIDAISEPYLLNGNQSVGGVGVSIGIALGNDHCTTHDGLLHNADLALYRAKSEGKGTYRFFEVEMDKVVRERRLIEQDLREALKNGELSLSYQPLVCAESQRTEGFEALVRWNHPVRGVVSPAEFIPIAESMGLISEIGDWVLMEACRQAVKWPEQLFVAVNLSPQQFVRGRIVESATNALISSGLQPSRLELEITEGLLINNTEEVTHALRELKGMGVSVALDDFGTGYSSLSYLLKFPFDKLKIDRSFITAIESDEVAKNVLEAIAKLGHVLELKVTAEGVETFDQMEALQAFNCTHFQGFLFGKPLSMEDLPAFLLSEANGVINSKQQAQPPLAGADNLQAQM